MTQDYPNCSQCGGAPTSRDEENCRFCSAPLPWSEYDLRSRRAVVLVPSRSMDDAVLRVETTPEFHRATLERRGVKTRHRRARRRRREQREHGAHGVTYDEDDATLHWIVCGVLVLPMAIFWGGQFVMQSPVYMAIAVLVIAGLAVWGARQSATTSTRNWRRVVPKTRRAEAAGILELGPPRAVSRRRDDMVRDVTLRLNRRRTKTFPADVELDLHAGDVGIARFRGGRMDGFERLEFIAPEQPAA